MDGWTSPLSRWLFPEPTTSLSSPPQQASPSPSDPNFEHDGDKEAAKTDVDSSEVQPPQQFTDRLPLRAVQETAKTAERKQKHEEGHAVAIATSQHDPTTMSEKTNPQETNGIAGLLRQPIGTHNEVNGYDDRHGTVAIDSYANIKARLIANISPTRESGINNQLLHSRPVASNLDANVSHVATNPENDTQAAKSNDTPVNSASPSITTPTAAAPTAAASMEQQSKFGLRALTHALITALSSNRHSKYQENSRLDPRKQEGSNADAQEDTSTGNASTSQPPPPPKRPPESRTRLKVFVGTWNMMGQVPDHRFGLDGFLETSSGDRPATDLHLFPALTHQNQHFSMHPSDHSHQYPHTSNPTRLDLNTATPPSPSSSAKFANTTPEPSGHVPTATLRHNRTPFSSEIPEISPPEHSKPRVLHFQDTYRPQNGNHPQQMDPESTNATFQDPFLEMHAGAPYHLIAINTQECQREIREAVLFPSKVIWERQIQLALGPDYVMLRSETMAALHLAVFIWKPIHHLVTAVDSSVVATGMGGIIGNKGAVAVAVYLGDMSFLFVNAHLTAHQSQTQARNSDYKRIIQELSLNEAPKVSPRRWYIQGDMRLRRSYYPIKSTPSKSMTGAGTLKRRSDGDSGKDQKEKERHHRRSTGLFARLSHTNLFSSNTNPSKPVEEDGAGKKKSRNGSVSSASSKTVEQTDITQQFDYTFWAGDLNYRVDMTRQEADACLAKDDIETLLEHDQLNRERAAGNVFSGFKEAPITFSPTYKFDPIPIEEILARDRFVRRHRSVPADLSATYRSQSPIRRGDKMMPWQEVPFRQVDDSSASSSTASLSSQLEQQQQKQPQQPHLLSTPANYSMRSSVTSLSATNPPTNLPCDRKTLDDYSTPHPSPFREPIVNGTTLHSPVEPPSTLIAPTSIGNREIEARNISMHKQSSTTSVVREATDALRSRKSVKDEINLHSDDAEISYNGHINSTASQQSLLQQQAPKQEGAGRNSGSSDFRQKGSAPSSSYRAHQHDSEPLREKRSGYRRWFRRRNRRRSGELLERGCMSEDEYIGDTTSDEKSVKDSKIGRQAVVPNPQEREAAVRSDSTSDIIVPVNNLSTTPTRTEMPSPYLQNSSTALAAGPLHGTLPSPLTLPPPSSPSLNQHDNPPLTYRRRGRLTLRRRSRHFGLYDHHDSSPDDDNSNVPMRLDAEQEDERRALRQSLQHLVHYDTSAKQRVPSWTDRILWKYCGGDFYWPALVGDDTRAGPGLATSSSSSFGGNGHRLHPSFLRRTLTRSGAREDSVTGRGSAMARKRWDLVRNRMLLSRVQGGPLLQSCPEDQTLRIPSDGNVAASNTRSPLPLADGDTTLTTPTASPMMSAVPAILSESMTRISTPQPSKGDGLTKLKASDNSTLRSTTINRPRTSSNLLETLRHEFSTAKFKLRMKQMRDKNGVSLPLDGSSSPLRNDSSVNKGKQKNDPPQETIPFPWLSEDDMNPSAVLVKEYTARHDVGLFSDHRPVTAVFAVRFDWGSTGLTGLEGPIRLHRKKYHHQRARSASQGGSTRRRNVGPVNQGIPRKRPGRRIIRGGAADRWRPLDKVLSAAFQSK